MLLVVFPVASVYAQSVRIPALAVAVAFVVGEAADVAAAVWVGHDAASVAEVIAWVPLADVVSFVGCTFCGRFEVARPGER